MMEKILWILFSVLAVMIGLYPSIYFFIDRKSGLLASKSEALLADIFWNGGFYTHIILGGLALLIGWIQFNSKFRGRHGKWHRRIGKAYIVSALISAIAGLYIAVHATGGLVTSLGFACLGIIWFSSTAAAHVYIKNGRKTKHQQMMIYSYAACFAAVMLRVWLPMLIAFFNDFLTAYAIVAWLCWIPNLVVAYLIARRIEIGAGKVAAHR